MKKLLCLIAASIPTFACAQVGSFPPRKNVFEREVYQEYAREQREQAAIQRHMQQRRMLAESTLRNVETGQNYMGVYIPYSNDGGHWLHYMNTMSKRGSTCFGYSRLMYNQMKVTGTQDHRVAEIFKEAVYRGCF